MSVHPAIGTGSVSTQQGLAQVISDLRRRLSQVEAARTVIQAGSITGGQIQTGSITANEILAGTITTELIAAGAIVAGAIAAGAITSEKIAASAILTEHLAAGSVTADEIAAGAITAGAIAAGAVTTTTLSAGAVTSDKIAAGAITSDKITVTSLSSLTSNLGSITAGTITGGTIQTAAAGARVVMDSGGLRGYALDGVSKVFEINAGSGIASFTGVANLSSSSVIPGAAITGLIPGASIPTIGGVNVLDNSSFEDGITGWTPSGTIGTGTMQAVAGWTQHGDKALRIYSTDYDLNNYAILTYNDFIPVTPGEQISLSTYVNATSVPTGTFIVNQWEYLDAAEQHVGWGPFPDDQLFGPGTKRLVNTTTVPPGVAMVRIRAIQIATTSARTAPIDVRIDAVQFERGGVVTAWTPSINDLDIGIGDVTEEMLADGAITASKIAAGAVIAGKIAAASISATELAANSVTALQIAAGSITASHIGAGSITADKISVEWGGSNMLWNSSFEDPTVAINMWESANADLQPSQVVIPVEGTQVLRISRPTGSGTVDVGVTSASGAVTGYPGTHPGYYPLVQGRPYTLSGWFTSAAVSKQARVEVNWFDSLYRQALPAPATTAVRTGSGTLAAAQYEYGVAALNANGQTVLSSTLITVVANSTVQITATLPADAVGTPFPVTGFRVYRRNITTSGAWAYVEVTGVTAGSAVGFNDTGSVTFTAGNPLGTSTATTVASATSLGALITTTVGAGSPSLPLTTDVIRVTHPLLVTDAGGTPATGSTVWTRAKLTATMPSGAAYARPVFRIQGVAVGEVHYLDAAMFEPGDVTTGFSRRSGEVMPGSVGSTQITPNSITTNQIMVGGIHADRIQAATITALQIATSAITADKIAAGEITATKIAAGAITASHIQSDAIDGKIITGATFQTAAPPTARMVMDTSGLRYIEADGTTALNLSTLSGSAGLNLLAASNDLSPENGRTVAFRSGAGTIYGQIFATNHLALGGMMFLRADAWVELGTTKASTAGNASVELRTSNNDPTVTFRAGSNNTWMTAAYTELGGNGRPVYLSNKLGVPVWVDPTHASQPALRADFVTLSNNWGRLEFDKSGSPVAAWLGESYGVSHQTTTSIHCLNTNSLLAGTNPAGANIGNGNIWATAFIGAWSDERAKQNIQPLTSPVEADALTRVRRVRGKKYDKLAAVPRFGSQDNPVPDDLPVRHREIGFLAQELEAEFPELVQTWAPTAARPMEMKWVDAGVGLSAVLWEAVNELAAEVDALKAQIGLPPGVALRTRA